MLTLLRFGRFHEILEVKERPANEVTGGFWDFAQGYAHLRQGAPDFARVYLARVVKAAETSSARFRWHVAKDLLGIVAGILEGEILRAEGDVDFAIAAFERAVEHDDARGYDEPEPLPFAACHWLGAALLEAKRFDGFRGWTPTSRRAGRGRIRGCVAPGSSARLPVRSRSQPSPQCRTWPRAGESCDEPWLAANCASSRDCSRVS